MRIVVVSQTYSAGNGQASFTIRLSESLVEHGHEVMVICPAESMHSYTAWQNGVRVEKVAALHMSVLHPAIYLTPFPAPRVKELYEEFKPELVHIQDHYFLCATAVQEAHRQGISVVGTNHFLPENILPFLKNLPELQRLVSIPLWGMMLSVFNRLDLATTPSETAARILRAQKIRVPVYAVSNGVNTARFRPDPRVDRAAVRRTYGLDPKKPVFLYVGRLDGEKRIDTLIDALAFTQRNDFQLAIGGQGRDEGLLHKRAHGLGDRVRFIGFIAPEELPSLYNSADVFVMPSPEELQSIATLEAMACGLPVLAANARALPELVQPGVSGCLFRPADPADAALRIEQMLAERGRWHAMGRAGRKHVQQHSLENTIQYYERLYRTAVEKILLKSGKAARRRVLTGEEP